MFCDGNIDFLTKRYPASELKVPFTYWLDVLRKIETKFIVDDLNYHFSGWAGRVKHSTRIAKIEAKHLKEYLERLSDSENFWLVLAYKENDKHYVYDCKIQPLLTLVNLSRGDFYIIDKKYSWFVQFNTNQEANTVIVCKSGISVTPFESAF